MCHAPSTDLEWKVVYVGSSAGPEHDQELDSVLVGPVPIGTSRFVLQTSPIDSTRIPPDDIIGATVSQGMCFARCSCGILRVLVDCLIPRAGRHGYMLLQSAGVYSCGLLGG